jgi:hypothetical protein
MNGFLIYFVIGKRLCVLFAMLKMSVVGFRKRSDLSRRVFLLGLTLASFFMASCSERMMPAGIIGYNHMSHWAIAIFTVNGAPGMNLNEGGGGGGESCCVSIPKHWRAGLRAKVAWQYDQSQDDKSPLPAPQQQDVEIPEYKESGTLQVHFYENHKVKIVISNCALGHPFYPMNLADQLPWSPNMSKKEALEIQKKGGMNNYC